MAKTIKSKIKNKENKKQMATKVTISGNALVLTSSIKLDTIKKMQKYNPDALVVCAKENEEIVEIFKIMAGTTGTICKAGIVFATEDKNGYATVTELIPECVKDKRQWVKENYASVLFMLQGLEQAIEDAEADVEKAFKELDSIITEV